jgi:ribosomal protein S12 methylthiotransferase
LRDLCSLKGKFYIRLLYLHPSSITDRLLHLIADEEKIFNYLDIPLQHSEDRILRLMKRPGGRDKYKRLIQRIRSIIPDVALRTTIITGFPTETEDEFRALLSFIKEMEFERLGVFMYSREEGTPAYHLRPQISEKVKKRRFSTLMEAQAHISLRKNQELVGKTFEALVDEVDDHIAIARIYSQAPEIDGVTMIERDDHDIKAGDIIRIMITEAYDYDLKGRIN